MYKGDWSLLSGLKISLEDFSLYKLHKIGCSFDHGCSLCAVGTLDFIGVYISFRVGIPAFKPKGDDMKCLSLNLIICSTDGERLDNLFEKEPLHLKQLLGGWEVILDNITGHYNCWNSTAYNDQKPLESVGNCNASASASIAASFYMH